MALLFLVTAASVCVRAGSIAPIVAYPGTCDASAAVALGDELFVVANDEDSILRVYRHGQPAPPVYSLDVSSFLKPDSRMPELDLEGAAPLGDRIYWIGSHSTNGKGQASPSRRRLFATEVKVTEQGVTLTPVGVPYSGLIQALRDTPSLRHLQFEKAAIIAPERPGGLNIEGLSATPTGGLLIGFRNPIPEGKALLIPLDNPAQVIQGEPVRLGDPVALELGGRGIRSIEYVAEKQEYLIVAGPADDRGEFGLYRWSGNAAEPPLPVPGVDFTGLQPEALAVPDAGAAGVWIFSDDGGRLLKSGKPCKDSRAPRQSFRGLSVAF